MNAECNFYKKNIFLFGVEYLIHFKALFKYL